MICGFGVQVSETAVSRPPRGQESEFLPDGTVRHLQESASAHRQTDAQTNGTNDQSKRLLSLRFLHKQVILSFQLKECAVGPAQRMSEVVTNMSALQLDKGGVNNQWLADWQLKIDSKPLKVRHRQCSFISFHLFTVER
jgi:hypothetical protein